MLMVQVLGVLLVQATHCERLWLRATDERAHRFYESEGIAPCNEPQATYVPDAQFLKLFVYRGLY